MTLAQNGYRPDFSRTLFIQPLVGFTNGNLMYDVKEPLHTGHFSLRSDCKQLKQNEACPHGSNTVSILLERHMRQSVSSSSPMPNMSLGSCGRPNSFEKHTCLVTSTEMPVGIPNGIGKRSDNKGLPAKPTIVISATPWYDSTLPSLKTLVSCARGE
ncbi:putative uncharacterized protein, putative [Babesia ovis]|uniref:Uncharacterized protein n=1 Tax=Babesia ovis TaxID=5869 RepID=A0A9W5WVX8_BABOV|nr:putative uncharacterized protein, putative [Babesia ovis]